MAKIYITDRVLLNETRLTEADAVGKGLRELYGEVGQRATSRRLLRLLEELEYAELKLGQRS